MTRRYILSPIPVICVVLTLTLLASLACGGATAPAPSDPGDTSSQTAAGSESTAANSDQPAATAVPVARSVDSTPARQVGRQQASSTLRKI